MDQLVTLLIALFGGGGLGVIVKYLADRRKIDADATARRTETALDGWSSLAADLRKDIERLNGDLERERERITAIEDQIKVERDMRWLAIRHIRRLYEWITAHVPDHEPPAPPAELAHHITPAKEYP